VPMDCRRRRSHPNSKVSWQRHSLRLCEEREGPPGAVAFVFKCVRLGIPHIGMNAAAAQAPRTKSSPAAGCGQVLTRRLERPAPPRLSHDGPGLATTQPQGRHDRSDFSKKCSGLPPFRVLSLEGASPVQHPPAARLRRRLTEDHIGALGRQSFLASTCDRRAAPSWRRSLNRWDRRPPRTRGRRR
jgi:hypothetical protein